MKKWLAFLLCFLLASPLCLAASSRLDDLGNDLSYSRISSRLGKIEKLTQAEKPDIDAMVDELSYLNETAAALDTSRRSTSEAIARTEKRIEALGEVNDDLPEARVISQKRREYNQELADEKARLSEIEILTAKIDEISLKIFDIRNQELWGNLLNSEGALINPGVFWRAGSELVAFGMDIVKSPFVRYDELTADQKVSLRNNIILMVVVITFISLLGLWLRRFVIRRWGYRVDIEAPRLGRKIIAAFAVWCAYGIIPTAIIGFCLYWILTAGILSSGFFGVVLSSALYYLLYIIIGRATCRVVFTPYNEKWRLINMPTDKARRLTRVIYLTIALVGIMAFLQHIVAVGKYSLELLSCLLAISSVIKAFCVVWIAHIYFAPLSTELEEDDDNGTEDTEEDEKEGRAFRIGMLISLFALGIIGLSMFGYPRLASFIINNSILSAIVIAVFSILRRLIYDVVQHVLLMGLWVKTFRMRRRFLRKLDFWFGIIAEPVLILLLLGALLLLWGVPFDVLKGAVYKAVSGFMVGGIEISLISIFWGVVIFVLCLWIIRFVRYRIEFRLLEKTNIDAGTKHSLASGFAYIAYVLAGILSIAVMGGNLTNIALIAGALSVGVGLGLQDIVNNFMSGIVMLFERPIKVGDWVVINGEEGKVKQINIRSTEVETFNRHSVIIPNSTVLSNSVTNLTHENNWVRYSVKVGVAYGTDVEKVKNILLECAASHPKVSKKQAPYVLFQDFGESSLDFELRFYVTDIWNGWTAPSDVRYTINRRFIEEGIEIPFRQMVIHHGSSVAVETDSQFYARKGAKKKNAD